MSECMCDTPVTDSRRPTHCHLCGYPKRVLTPVSDTSGTEKPINSYRVAHDPHDECRENEIRGANPIPPLTEGEYTELIEARAWDESKGAFVLSMVSKYRTMEREELIQALLSLQQERDALDRRATEYAMQGNDQALRITALQQKNKELEESLDEAAKDEARYTREWTLSQSKLEGLKDDLERKDKALEAFIAAVTYTDREGRSYIGIHGDSDVTQEVESARSALSPAKDDGNGRP